MNGYPRSERYSIGRERSPEVPHLQIATGLPQHALGDRDQFVSTSRRITRPSGEPDCRRDIDSGVEFPHQPLSGADPTLIVQ